MLEGIELKVLAHGLTDAVLPVPPESVQALGIVGIAIIGLRMSAGRRPATEPRYLLPLQVGRRGRRVLQLVISCAAGLVVLTGLFGSGDYAVNPGPRLLFVLFPLSLGLASLLAGPIWPQLNPLRGLSAWVALSDEAAAAADTAATEQDRRGAAALLFVFLLISVVFNTPLSAAATVVAYSLVAVAAGAFRGPQWFDRWDPFELFSTLLGQMAPLHVDGVDGRTVRGAAKSLLSASSWPGFRFGLAVIIGQAVFESVSETPWWIALTADVAGPLGDAAGFTLIVLSAYTLMTLMVRSSRVLPALVPVAAAYLVAHWIAPLILDTQLVARQLADPFAQGWTVFGGLSQYEPVEWPAPEVLASLVALTLLGGHLVAAATGVARSTQLLPAASAAGSQLGLLILVATSLFIGLSVTVNS